MRWVYTSVCKRLDPLTYVFINKLGVVTIACSVSDSVLIICLSGPILGNIIVNTMLQVLQYWKSLAENAYYNIPNEQTDQNNITTFYTDCVKNITFPWFLAKWSCRPTWLTSFLEACFVTANILKLNFLKKCWWYSFCSIYPY